MFMVMIEDTHDCEKRHDPSHSCGNQHLYVVVARSPEEAARAVQKERRLSGCSDPPEYLVASELPGALNGWNESEGLFEMFDEEFMTIRLA